MKKLIVMMLLATTVAASMTSCKSSDGNSKELSEDSAIPETVEQIESPSSSSDESYSVSSGYSTDPDYRPTVSDDGDYHTIDGKRRQIQYQGSQEQQRDLDMIDEYMRNHPDY